MPLPPKIQLDKDPQAIEPEQPQRQSRLDMLNSKPTEIIGKQESAIKIKNVSVDPPIIRRDTYNGNGFPSMANSYNNTKYGFVNPINGLMHSDMGMNVSVQEQIELN